MVAKRPARDKYLVRVSGIGKDEPGIVHRITSVVSLCGGNVLRLHSLRVVGEYALTLIASTDSDTDRRKMLRKLDKLKINERFILVSDKLEKYESPTQDGIKHVVTIIGDDRAGILQQITKIFVDRGLSLIAVEADSSENFAFSGTPTFKSEFTMRIPHNFPFAPLVAEIKDYAVANNLIHHVTRLP